MPKVSIIIPIYNAEKTLKRCVESVLTQDFQDFELILMNDGSKDSSKEICDEFAKNDARIRVIHKENSGVSDTRNQGIGLAKGEYIQFMDSDDWITRDSTAVMVEAADRTGCGMVITDFYRVVGDYLSAKGKIKETGILTREEYALEMMENPADFYYGVLWNKLFRRDIIEKFHLRMDQKISWCEDFLFNMEYVKHVEEIYVLHVPTYYYIKTEGSLVSQSMNIATSLQTKQIVFKRYKEFYKEIFESEDSSARVNVGVYRYLIDIAGDGAVAPAIFPTTKKLGDERTKLSSEIAQRDGRIISAYRERKLLDRRLETIGFEYELSLEETELLYCLYELKEEAKPEDLADMLQMTHLRCNFLLRLLEQEGYVEFTVVKPDKKAGDTTKEYELVTLSKENAKEKGRNIQEAFADCERAIDEARFEGLTEEEIALYRAVQAKVQANTKKVLG